MCSCALRLCSLQLSLSLWSRFHFERHRANLLGRGCIWNGLLRAGKVRGCFREGLVSQVAFHGINILWPSTCWLPLLREVALLLTLDAVVGCVNTTIWVAFGSHGAQLFHYGGVFTADVDVLVHVYLVTIHNDCWWLSLGGGILVRCPQRTLDLISSNLFLDLSQLYDKLFLVLWGLESRYPCHLISSLSQGRVQFLIYLGK